MNATKRRTYRAKRSVRPRRRTYRKKMGVKRKLRPMYKNINYPLATSVVKRLKYVERIQLNPALTGAIASYTFAANDLFDPNRSGTGHQPYGFDQLMALYNHYQVTGSKITITVTAGQNESFVYGMQLNDSLTMSSANVEAICEQPFARRKVIAAGTNNVIDLTISNTFSLAKYFGAKVNRNSLIGNRTYMGTETTSPTEAAFFVIWCAANGPTIDPSAIQFHVEIEYIARFSEPKDLAQS